MSKNASLILKSLISLILLYLILEKLGIEQLISRLSDGKLEYLLYGILLGLVCNLIKLYKWTYLVDGTLICSFWDGLRSYTIGNTLGLITPLRVGELGRALYFDKRYYSRIAGLTIFDRALDVAAVLILSVLGAFFFFGTKIGIVTILLNAALIISLYNIKKIWHILKNFVPNKYQKIRLIELLSSVDHLSVFHISIFLLFSLLAFSISIIELYFLILAFEIVSFKAVVLSIPLMSLSNILPISIMGLGVREGVAFYLLAKFSVTGCASVSASLLSFFINNLLLGIIGILFIPKITFANRDNV